MVLLPPEGFDGVSQVVLEVEGKASSQATESAYGIGFRRVFGFLEVHCDMTLRGKVVDFIGLHLLDYTDEASGVSVIAMMKDKTAIRNVRVLAQMIDAVGVI